MHYGRKVGKNKKRTKSLIVHPEVTFLYELGINALNVPPYYGTAGKNKPYWPPAPL